MAKVKATKEAAAATGKVTGTEQEESLKGLSSAEGEAGNVQGDLLPPVPHGGSVSETVEEESDDTPDTPARRGRPPGSSGAKRSHKKKPAPIDPSEVTEDDLADARVVLDALLFLPAEFFLGFESPQQEMQMRMSRLGARLAVKWFGDDAKKDEYKLAALIVLWIGRESVSKLGARRDKRDSHSVGTQTNGKNPLDALVPETVPQRSVS